jgi:hypothetical protein
MVERVAGQPVGTHPRAASEQHPSAAETYIDII